MQGNDELNLPTDGFDKYLQNSYNIGTSRIKEKAGQIWNSKSNHEAWTVSTWSRNILLKKVTDEATPTNDSLNYSTRKSNRYRKNRERNCSQSSGLSKKRKRGSVLKTANTYINGQKNGTF